VHQLRGTELKRLHRTWKRRSSGRLALLLDSVVSPYNVGSIVRTAAALGVSTLYLAGESPSPRGPKVQKTALGTDRYLTCHPHELVADAARQARADGFHLVALELTDDAVPLPSLQLDRDVCLVLGHEDRGVSANGLAACDAVAFLPQLGRVGSLNVASAAAMGCYEVRRQGWAAGEGFGPGPTDDDGADPDGGASDGGDAV
jgi:tRNA (guanosine-2'-O-)-methyltransferase